MLRGRKRGRKANDTKTLDRRDVIKKIAKTVPESAIFQELSAYEKRLDSYLLSKQMVINDAINCLVARPNKTLSLSIYNTHNEQGGFYQLEPTSNSVSSWTLRIEGQVLDDNRKFTSFIKKIFVKLDPELFPDNHIIEWDRTQDHSLESDGFEIHRAGNVETIAHIYIHLAYSPSRYKLSSELAKILNLHTDTRARILVRLCQYVKTNSHGRDPNDHKSYILSPQLQMIFGKQSITLAEMPDLLRDHLGPPDPIEFQYNIRLSGDLQQNIQTYEIQISDSKPSDSSPLAQEIQTIDDKISDLISQIDQHRTTRDFMLAFQKNPVEFLNDLIASQCHENDITNSDTREGEAIRLAKFYQQPKVNEAVALHLDRIGQSYNQ